MKAVVLNISITALMTSACISNYCLVSLRPFIIGNKELKSPNSDTLEFQIEGEGENGEASKFRPK